MGCSGNYYPGLWLPDAARTLVQQPGGGLHPAESDDQHSLDRAPGVLHGDTLSAGIGKAQQTGTRNHSMGLGHQWLRLGD